ncbi:polysaccharide deacetylase family protein [Piscinibacter sp. XHJ-5]|uniref:polysaccharide deacetylase family protein n=1 Tax=Piscinibacter sp. XHJ-5 TaxID=3037797 RepID=UPI002452F7A6|nr:polysaccharide deacetylase family protein [Piscinibacter sp. XHJ-5]
MRILTFDIEDWFHVLDNPATDAPAAWPGLDSRVERNTDRILDELGSRGMRATFFCLGWVAEHHPGLVRRIAAQGHEVGTHSHAHLPIDRQQRGTFEADLVRSMKVLEDLTGQAVTFHRAPGFSLTPACGWAVEVLLAHGISVDCSVFPLRRPGDRFDVPLGGPFTIHSPHGRLLELPVSAARCMGMRYVCGGSGYFRLAPQGVVRRHLARDDYVMSYFHPRDFDSAQPWVEGLSLFRQIKLRVGLRRAWSRFRRVLDEFDFVCVGDAVRRIDWATAPVVPLTRHMAGRPSPLEALPLWGEKHAGR